MKFTIALPLAFAATVVAAPTEIEKRIVGQLTLYTGASYSGQSTTLSIDTNGGCVAMPAAFNNRVVSVRINPQQGAFFCRIYDNAGCAASDDTNNDTWFFFQDIPNLGTAANRGSSIECADNGNGN